MPPKKISEELRQQVQKRARNYCEYCRYPGRIADQGQLTVDHIKPIQLGGENELENLACCCTGCNQRKSKKTRGIDPETSEEVALFNPRKQAWTEHFEWSSNFTRVIAKTACDRATEKALQLNREGVVRARADFLLIPGLHPP